MTSENIISIGRSDYGITTAAEYSAITLSQITLTFLKLFHHGDSTIAMKYISDWVKEIQNNYFTLQDEIFPKSDD